MKKMIFLLYFLSIFLFLTINSAAATIYELPINISSTGSALANYQVKVTITNTIILGHIASDGRDIRFFNQQTANPYNTTTGMLNLWIESISPSQLVVWVKVDSIPASGGKIIYMYYGNPYVSSASNADNTFVFFDNFNDNSIDTLKWKTYTANGGAVSESGGEHVNSGDTNWWGANSYTNVSIPFGNYTIKFKERHPTHYSSAPSGYIALVDKNTVTFATSYYASPNNNDIYLVSHGDVSYASCEIQIIIFNLNTTHVTYNSTVLSGSCSGGTVAQTTAAFTGTIGANSLSVDFGTAEYQNNPTYWDNISITKYTSPEPTASVGMESMTANYTIKIYVNSQPSDVDQSLVKTCGCGTNSTCDCTFTYPLVETTYGKAETWLGTTFLSSSGWILIYTQGPYFSDFTYSGSTNYFNIFWNVTYSSQINVSCIFDCDPRVQSCNAAQKCSPYPITQSPGRGGCTVLNPSYNFTGKNKLFCNITDVINPNVSTSYPETPEYTNSSMSFWAVNFAVDVKNAIAGNAGDTINLPVNVQNLGVLADNYTVNATPISFAESISLDSKLLTTNLIKTNEFGSVYLQVTLLSKSTNNPQIGIWIYSNADKYSCSSAADCNMIQSFERNTTCEVVSHKCAIYRIVDVSTSLKNMPEIGFFEIMQIFVFASLIALITFK